MTVTCKLISETVAKAYGLTVRDLNSSRTEKAVVLPRHISWALAKNLTGRSLPEIGRYMGGRDHSTILSGVRKIAEKIDADPQIASSYARLAETIIVLGEESKKSDRLPIRFEGIDPLDLADAFLEARFCDVAPTMEAMRALCRGIRHYSDEVDSLTAMLAKQAVELEQARQALVGEAARLTKERSALEDRISNLSLGNAKTEALAQHASTIAAKFKALRLAETTVHERPARRALEVSLQALQTTFERN